jgi:hypothetical protein
MAGSSFLKQALTTLFERTGNPPGSAYIPVIESGWKTTGKPAEPTATTRDRSRVGGNAAGLGSPGDAMAVAQRVDQRSPVDPERVRARGSSIRLLRNNCDRRHRDNKHAGLVTRHIAKSERNPEPSTGPALRSAHSSKSRHSSLLGAMGTARRNLVSLPGLLLSVWYREVVNSEQKIGEQRHARLCSHHARLAWSLRSPVF